jgi:hypothetical protein
MKNNIIILVILSVPFFVHYSLSAGICGEPMECPKGIKYPYNFCNSETGTFEI